MQILKLPIKLSYLLILCNVVSLGLAQQLCEQALAPYTVQGHERRSAYVGQEVITKGIITGLFLAKDALEGLFIQDPLGDADPFSSDALFISLKISPPDLRLGQEIAVMGKVLERNELTQIAAKEIILCEETPRKILARPLLLNSLVSISDYEALEGMLITFPERLYVSEVYNLGRYGEVLLSAMGRLYHPNNGQADPQNPLPRLLLNDGSLLENPPSIPYLFEAGAERAMGKTLRLGTSLRGLTGVLMNYGLGAYRLEPTQPPRFSFDNPRSPAPDKLGGDISVASFNVLNYFTTLDLRGANSPAEFARQETKLLTTLLALDADIIGLIEIENNDEALTRLIAQLNEKLGPDTYAAIPDLIGGMGDQIKVAIIYKQQRLKALYWLSDPHSIHDRPPLAASFKTLEGATFNVIVSHFKSKGSCPSTGDTDRGQGCWTQRRSAQARPCSTLLKAFKTKVKMRMCCS
ncbi:MAG: ExeM/NucH family extracellular endonuclease [Deinococcales bacterium]